MLPPPAVGSSTIAPLSPSCSSVLAKPSQSRVRRANRRTPGCSVSVCQARTRRRAAATSNFRRHRVPMDPQHVQELRPVRIGRQQACQDGRPAGDEGASRPPDMKAIRGRKRRHRRPLSQALDADLRDRQPFFDQPAGPSWFGLFHRRPGSSRCNEDDIMLARKQVRLSSLTVSSCQAGKPDLRDLLHCRRNKPKSHTPLGDL